MAQSYRVRPAQKNDKQEIANLMFFERHVHRHLDWQHPTDWLGSPFYWVLERNERIMAVLACPQDQKETTWVRLFTHAENFSAEEAWQILWENAKQDIAQSCNKITIAAITLQEWMQTLLQTSGFKNTERILALEWTGEKHPPRPLPQDVRLRAMRPADLPQVAKVDAAAFAPLWHNPLSMLKQAYGQALFATVAETEKNGIIAYQISTHSPYGAHLARLAVHPTMQRRGIASALIGHLTNNLLERDITQLSVNTQSKNNSSIALYTQNGFIRTEEEYPLYSFQIIGADEKGT
jgi:ribosomal protein S18 acetylase RimI-like enzyme